MDKERSTPFAESHLSYQNGFGNHFTSEALPGALPKNQNNPQRCSYGLYAEQLSGTPFTMVRSKNQFSWLYRILPSSAHRPFQKTSENSEQDGQGLFLSNFASESDPRLHVDPQQFRWKPAKLPAEEESVNFMQGVKTLCGSGDPSLKQGLGMHVYVCNQNMHRSAFYSADGDLLVVPQQGTLFVTTEMGRLTVSPLEICVLPRGVKFKVDLDPNESLLNHDQRASLSARGYICETFKSHFQLPDLGPIGSNGLANPTHFQYPCAWFEDDASNWRVVAKFAGKFFEYDQDHSPFDVVAWHGNYAPFKYDLTRFNTLGSISYDHPDPSIFTVLTCPSDEPGQAVCDFAIFPPRWLAAEHTFRPPYFHRNTMSEFMGNIKGVYDAKEKGFGPGAASLHSAMSGHGPEAEVFEKATFATKTEEPQFVGKDGMAFMFETCYLLKVSSFALEPDQRDLSYVQDAWGSLKKHFAPGEAPV